MQPDVIQKDGNKFFVLYDPKDGSPFHVPQGVNWQYYLGKGYLVKKPEVKKAPAKS